MPAIGSALGVVCGPLELDRYRRLLACVPSVVTRCYPVDLACLDVGLSTIFMLEVEATRNHVADVLHLAALSPNHRLDAF